MATKHKDPNDPKEIKEPDPDEVDVDIDDAQIEEPKDDAFRKAPQPAQPPKRQRKKA